jgi:hypothetical protein
MYEHGGIGMKNKDGIVIKPGQVWKSTEGVERRVVAKDQGEFITRRISDGLLGVHSELREVFHILIKSHDGADLKSARAEGWEVWVEGMEKPDPDTVELAEYWYISTKEGSEWLEAPGEGQERTPTATS